MKVSDLVKRWDFSPSDRLAAQEYRLRLSVRDAARIEALSTMHPQLTATDILSDLVRAALDELECALPYIPGQHVIAEDDLGDPIFEDVGPTPRFFTLTQEYARKLARG
jgi:hypothetical protein